MRKRTISYISDSTVVSAGSNNTIEWVQEEDGNIKIKEVTVAFDTILQADGTFSVEIAGDVPANAIDSPNSVSSWSLQDMETPIPKGSKVKVYIVNGGSSDGEAQLLVHAYEEINSMEDILMSIAKMLRDYIFRSG